MNARVLQVTVCAPCPAALTRFVFAEWPARCEKHGLRGLSDGKAKEVRRIIDLEGSVAGRRFMQGVYDERDTEKHLGEEWMSNFQEGTWLSKFTRSTG